MLWNACSHPLKHGADFPRVIHRALGANGTRRISEGVAGRALRLGVYLSGCDVEGHEPSMEGCQARGGRLRRMGC